MKNIIVLFLIAMQVQAVTAQSIAAKLGTVVQQFEMDEQLRHGIISFCVVDAQTGKPVYNHNAQLGLPAASTQKLFTSVASFELLGKDYRYKTKITYDGSIQNGTLNGNLYITGYGDPTFGSWRWNDTKEEAVLGKIAAALQQHKITRISGNIIINDSAFSVQPIPGGWIWDDIGNYYGAGCGAINWHENQYDLYLQPGKQEGDTTHIIKTVPGLQDVVLINHITTGKKGSGDNGYIYLPPYSATGFTLGTIPQSNDPFVIAGAFPDGAVAFIHALQGLFKKELIRVDGTYKCNSEVNKVTGTGIQQELTTLLSPPLDSINYWFLKKSINLYGEALVKTMAYEKSGFGSTDKGVDIVRSFWSDHGIDKSAVNIIDGSGLSPQNRVTSDGEVKVLQYAKTRPWFSAFYNALPEFNGMKMKSGSIGGARAFAGYHTAKDGKQYIFSIIVNNYDGSAGDVVKKMYRVLDVLK
jgi:D-alanyl-D-alanine carboxypeptidase/D-alanyl-D-alanine-endopeptidase (penicillin-binding protein 4)